MNINFKDGVWPVMLTPFSADNKVDYESLERLVDWYIDNGVAGLFAVCQSSEMFFLSLEERVEITKAVKKFAAGRVPVIASGHVSDSLDDQVKELQAISSAGADAVILITNRLAKQDESDDIWLENLKYILDRLDSKIPLGFYECPYPYKRVLSSKTTQWCAQNGRFYFLKDTSCDIDNIKMKLEIIKGTHLHLFNANTATLLQSLEYGASGYSGVMANIHPNLYVHLCNHFTDKNAEALSDNLTMLSLMETQCYPVNAKYYLKKHHIIADTYTRVTSDTNLTQTYKSEVDMLDRINLQMEQKYLCQK